MHASRAMHSLPRHQRGSVMALVVLALAAILLMAALALDGSHMLVNKTRLQNAVDAAALSGAKTLQQVMGSGNAGTLSRDAALDTFRRNAEAAGNRELGEAVGSDLSDFVRVELAASVYGPFAFPGPTDARYVRVTVAEFPLARFFWGMLSMFGSDADKRVAAVATAGPSPTIAPCKIEPILVCGDPTKHNPENNKFWGYEFGDLVALTCDKPGSPSAGNCQLLRLAGGSGGAAIREAFCAGVEQCTIVGDSVDTEPGMTWGPVAQGLNTRLGIYNGPVNATSCPADWFTDYSEPLVVMDGSTPKFQGQEVISNSGNLSAGGTSLVDANDWQQTTQECASNPDSCSGVAERRMLNVVIGDCAGVAGSGATSVPVLGFGCFYLLQRVEQGGTDKQVLGQFVRECQGDGVAGPAPTEDSGPQIIQLYKTYIDNNRTPSSDS